MDGHIIGNVEATQAIDGRHENQSKLGQPAHGGQEGRIIAGLAAYRANCVAGWKGGRSNGGLGDSPVQHFESLGGNVKIIRVERPLEFGKHDESIDRRKGAAHE